MMAQDATTKESPTPPSYTSSIQFFNREIERLTKLVDKWNKIYVFLLVLSVIVACVTVYSQFKTIRFARDLSILSTRMLVAMMAQDATSAKESPTSQSYTFSIQFFNREIERLTELVDKWNDIYVCLLVLSVIVACVTVYSQFKTIQLARGLSDRQARLDSAKDRELAESLKSKDVEIQNAKLAGSAADEAAGKANEAAATANERALLLNERALKLEADTQKLRQDNIKAEEKLEEERKKRLLLAVSLLPRNFRDQSGAIAKLKLHRDITAIFEYVDQDEPLSLAKQIYFVLAQSSWHLVKRPQARPGGLFKGVKVHPGTGMPRLLRPGDTWFDDSRQTALVNAIVASGIETEIGFPECGSRSLVIRIGKKPDTFLNESLEELGAIPPTDVGGLKMGGNEAWFPEQPPPSSLKQ